MMNCLMLADQRLKTLHIKHLCGEPRSEEPVMKYHLSSLRF